MVSNKMLCPNCGQVIGEYLIGEKVNTSIGSIPTTRILKNEYAGKIGLRINKKDGILCKNCVNTLFPKGYTYEVIVTKSNNWTTKKGSKIHRGGVDGRGTFASRKEARILADEINGKDNGITVKVSQHKI